MGESAKNYISCPLSEWTGADLQIEWPGHLFRDIAIKRVRRASLALEEVMTQ